MPTRFAHFDFVMHVKSVGCLNRTMIRKEIRSTKIKQYNSNVFLLNIV